MEQLLEISIASIVAIFIVTGLFYECLCFISHVVSRTNAGPRPIMYIMVTGVFIAHGAAIFIYATIYWILIHFLGFADLSGNVQDHFPTYLYFSATSYSSLGVGDVFPVDTMRFLTGIEALNGLLLITWSAAFTYFSIQKMWETHGIETKFLCK
ncbi:MAG: ion transporter [Sneathiella sp.]|jgi:hypothetical protein|uniref:ion channel n=1 Tax=Sneathiella sp. TaxID=1964365 RepID=UPI000C55462A|nr:ion channel [Sneathiella sp.]MAZ03937.1 ion transporter [Sneathiella sp.]|tara:strand:+ start:373 stop:834 length:462 start_codon:yes stop_codon:yes gene_type:complete